MDVLGPRESRGHHDPPLPTASTKQPVANSSPLCTSVSPYQKVSSTATCGWAGRGRASRSSTRSASSPSTCTTRSSSSSCGSGALINRHFFGPVSGPESCPSHFWSFETYLNLKCLSTEFAPEHGPVLCPVLCPMSIAAALYWQAVWKCCNLGEGATVAAQPLANNTFRLGQNKAQKSSQ